MFLFISGEAIKKKSVSQLDSPATTKRLIMLAASNLNYPSHLREHHMQVTGQNVDYEVVWGPLPQSAFYSSRRTLSTKQTDNTSWAFRVVSWFLLHARHRAIETDSSANHVCSPVCANPLFCHQVSLYLRGMTRMPEAAPAHHTIFLLRVTWCQNQTTSTVPYDFENWGKNRGLGARTREGILPPAQKFLVDIQCI